MSEQLHVQISELSGGIPEIPLAEGVDYSALVAGDVDPVFLTLPLLETGAVSRNGRRYDRTAVNALVEQINKNQPGGILGHLPENERSTRFDLPSLMWVGATVDADGKAWGKAYIPQYATAVREYVLKSKARRAQIATSIYGTAKMDGDAVRDLQIETIDLADPARAGVLSAVSEPFITREMSDDETEGNMPDQNELITELRTTRDRIQEQLKAAEAQVSELTTRVAELTTHENTVTQLRAVVPQGDLVEAVTEMAAVVKEAIQEQKKAKISEAVDAALGEIAKHEAGAKLVREMVGEPDTPEAATARVKAVLEMDHVKAALRGLVSQPGAIVGELFKDDGKADVEAIIEQAPQLAAKFGLV